MRCAPAPADKPAKTRVCLSNKDRHCSPRGICGSNVFGKTAFRVLLGLVAPLTISSIAAADDARVRYPEQYTMTPLGTNVQTGRFHYSATDLVIGNLKFERFYETRMGSPDAVYGENSLGQGWRHNLDQGMMYDGTLTTPARVSVGGHKYNFVGNYSGGVHLPADHGSQGMLLENNAPIYFLSDKAGTLYRIDQIEMGPAGAAGDQYRVAFIVRGDGTREDYTYNSSGKLRMVSSNTGYAIIIDYNASQAVSAVCGFNLAETYVNASSTCSGAALKVSYGYNAAGTLLTSVTDTNNGVTQITWASVSGVNMPACISRVNSSTCAIQNYFGPQPGDNPAQVAFTMVDQNRVQKSADNATWTFGYQPEEDPADVPFVAGKPRYSRSWMTDPAGRSFNFRYDRGTLIESYGPDKYYTYHYASRDITRYTQTGGGNSLPQQYAYFSTRPGLVTDKRSGMRDYYRHDSRGNITHHSIWPKDAPAPAGLFLADPDLANCCISSDPVTPPAGSWQVNYTFKPDWVAAGTSGSFYSMGCGAGQVDAKLCDKPVSRTDSAGRATDYVYDQGTGLMLSETGPADDNGVRPQTRFAYAERYAWWKNASGNFVRATLPIWVLTSKSLCKTSAATGNPSSPCSAGASDEVRTLYDYGPDSGPNNLLLRGVVEDATGTALRTCYGYDWQGRRISETRPLGTGGSCP